jgi:polyketide cyclase/dehydrase/lipid transport protein
MAHDALRDWCKANHHQFAGPSWELYGHWQPEWNANPSLIRTDVFYQIAATARHAVEFVMPEAIASATGIVRAPATVVYRIIADYREHHPRIVPPEYFTGIEVEEGGVGAGTRTRVHMRVFGRKSEFIHFIREPEPGRVLEEIDSAGATATTFTVEPDQNGAGTKVTIETRFRVRAGLLGALERRVTRFVLHRIYRKELARLDEYSRSGVVQP